MGRTQRADPTISRRIFDRAARLSTGFKLFLLLSLALLPLALVVLFAALQSVRDNDAQRLRYQIAALEESSRRLGARFGTDAAAMRAAASSGATFAECDRTRRLLRTGIGVASFALVRDERAAPLCGPLTAAIRERALALPDEGVHRFIDQSSGQLYVVVGGTRGAAIVSYTAGAIANAVRPTLGSAQNFAIVLVDGERRLPLVDEIRDADQPRRRALVRPIPGAGDLVLEMRSVAPGLTPDALLMILLPMLMWVAAAGIGWLVVDRLLLTPLTALRRAIDRYEPGQVLASPSHKGTVARELQELGSSFRGITETVAMHEAELAAGLERQRRLTREVHHRVKNNLQVVASLINIHSRGARTDDAAEAYAIIQRRVDALAVVHRNHYAEMEVNLGVALRPLLGEIAVNLRAGAGNGRPAIHVDAAPLNVTQDVAVPVAFLLTELVELALSMSPSTTIRIAAAADGPDHARISVTSPALVSTETLGALVGARYGRVLEGLARQLRVPLERDAAIGSFAIRIPVLVPDKNFA